MRVVIFTDYDNTATLVEATLAEIERRPDWEVVAVYTTAPRLLRDRSWWRSSRRITGSLVRGRRPRRAGRCAAACRRHGIPLLMVPDRDPNGTAFLEEMRNRWSPDVALSYWSVTIFGDEWIRSFDHALNFHDGLIPDHRGVGATAMEVYEDRTEGGYTFHRIDRGIDTGNILLDGTVPMAGLTMSRIIEAKLVAGGTRVSEVLDRVAAGDPGRAPEGEGSYTSGAMISELARVGDPSGLERRELERRIRALGSVWLPVSGGAAPVTGLARGRGLGWPRLTTADGGVTVSRIDGLPAPVALLGRAIRRWLGRRGPSW